MTSLRCHCCCLEFKQLACKFEFFEQNNKITGFYRGRSTARRMDLTVTSQLFQVGQIYELERQYVSMWEVEVPREANF